MSQTLDRALTILVLVAERPRRVNEVAEALEVHPSTAFRLLHTMRSHAFVQEVGDHQYRLGPATFRLGFQALVDPPAHAIVLSVDEKSQIQALDRTQPGLPIKKGRAGTMTHDYKRHGTTTLFAALNVLDGTVIGRNMQRHRHQEFIRFLNAIEAQVPVGKMVHVILDNYGAHKHPKVCAWLDRHPRFTFHFVPTSCSWLNAVEGFFAKLSRQRLKRGVFRSVYELQIAINRYLDEANQMPKPFSWTADPDKIIAAVRRGHQVLDSIH